MQADQLSPEREEALTTLIENLNERLESAGQDITSRAFNLGCSVGLLPGALIVLLAFFFSRGSLAVAMITALLVLVSLLALANLAAYVARSRTLDRTYQLEILPEIEHNLHQMGVPLSAFGHMVAEKLPEGAVLLAYTQRSGENDPMTFATTTEPPTKD